MKIKSSEVIDTRERAVKKGCKNCSHFNQFYTKKANYFLRSVNGYCYRNTEMTKDDKFVSFGKMM